MARGDQGTLLEAPARSAPRKLMHVFDAGCNGPGPGFNARFRCSRCNHLSEWMPIGQSEARRGIPCPKCSAEAEQ